MQVYSSPEKEKGEPIIVKFTQEEADTLASGFKQGHLRLSRIPAEEPNAMEYWRKVMPPEVFAEYYPEG